jgi:dTDP-4-amino-4,6-dideoxygalactose transaminase
MRSTPLAVNGGKPVRTKPLPLEFPGVHYMDSKEVKAAVRLLKSKSLFRYYGLHPRNEVEKLEAELARFIGVKCALAVSSGTGALHTALTALGVGPGQEIIVPAYLWVSILAAVINLGAIPVLADIDHTFCLNAEDVEKKITRRTRGIIVAHMSGAPANVKSLQRIARDRGLFLLEDCAQANGASVAGRRVGTFGDMAIFSFQMNKNMTVGEGGAVVTNDLHLWQRAFAAHDLGYARDKKGRLIFNDPSLCLWGRGYRLDELRGAVLRVQLRKLPRIIRSMHRSKYRIRRALEKFPGVQLRKIADPAGDTGCFLITTYPDAKIARKVNLALRAEGIVTSLQGLSNVVMTDWGLHLYSNNVSLVKKSSTDRRGFPWKLSENAPLQHDYGKGACPVADSLFERSILIPIPSCLTRRDENDIILAFEKVLSVYLRHSG